MAERFGTFLEASLNALAREWPRGFAQLAGVLRGFPVAVEVSDDPCVVLSDGVALRVSRVPSDAPVQVRTTRAVVLDLVDGGTTVLDAALAGMLDLRGDVDSLVRFDEAFRLYLHGAARAPSFPTLLARFRGGS